MDTAIPYYLTYITKGIPGFSPLTWKKEKHFNYAVSSDKEYPMNEENVYVMAYLYLLGYINSWGVFIRLV